MMRSVCQTIMRTSRQNSRSFSSVFFVFKDIAVTAAMSFLFSVLVRLTGYALHIPVSEACKSGGLTADRKTVPVF